jgi:hypothetical protein
MRSSLMPILKGSGFRVQGSGSVRSCLRALVLWCVGVCLLADVAAEDDVTAENPLIPPLFSIDLASPEVAGGLLLAGDVLWPGADPTLPEVVIPAANLSLFDPTDDVDALALGGLDVGWEDTFVAIFSVDRDAVGAVPPDPNLVALGFPFNVQDQAAKNQAAGDAFMSLFLLNRLGPLPLKGSRAANNTLVINQGDAGGVHFRLSPAGLSPSLPNPPGTPQSDVDGAAGTQPPPPRRTAGGGAKTDGERAAPIFFSLSAGSPSLPTLPGTGSGADVYVDMYPDGPGGEMLYVEPFVLGLVPADDIDALIIFDNGDFVFSPEADQVIFSLAPDSPSLGGEFGPGDLFTSWGGGFFEPYCLAPLLGLEPIHDNLNMLDYVLCDDVMSGVRDWAIGFGCGCIGDIDGDGRVDLGDLAILLSCYGLCEGQPGYVPAADLEPDACINLGDLAMLLAHYGEICP